MSSITLTNEPGKKGETGMLVEKNTETTERQLVINLEAELKGSTWEEVDSNPEFMDTRPVLPVCSYWAIFRHALL